MAGRNYARERIGYSGGVVDILCNHGFAQPVLSHQNQIADLIEEVQCEGAFDDVALDLGGSVPFGIGHEL